MTNEKNYERYDALPTRELKSTAKGQFPQDGDVIMKSGIGLRDREVIRLAYRSSMLRVSLNVSTKEKDLDSKVKVN